MEGKEERREPSVVSSAFWAPGWVHSAVYPGNVVAQSLGGILWEMVCEPEEARWRLGVRISREEALKILGVSPSIWVYQ